MRKVRLSVSERKMIGDKTAVARYQTIQGLVGQGIWIFVSRVMEVAMGFCDGEDLISA